MSIPTFIQTLAVLPATTKHVARDCRIEPAAATARVNRLRRMGLAHRVWIPTDEGEAYLKNWASDAKGDLAKLKCSDLSVLLMLPATTKLVEIKFHIAGGYASSRMNKLKEAGLVRLVWIPTEEGEKQLLASAKLAKSDKLQDTGRVKRYTDSIERVAK